MTDVVPELIRKIVPALPRFSIGETVIPSGDGSVLYVFAGSRHLRTLDALTGAARLVFTYDSVGRLTGMRDIDENSTTIERNAMGDPIAIVAPGGQRTTIAVDSNGYLKRITDPAGQVHVLVHDDTGLLVEMTTPRQMTHIFTYDENGRLLKDIAPDSYSLTLARSGTGDAWNVTAKTTLGRITTVDRQRQPDGTSRRLTLFPSGLRADKTTAPSGAVTLFSPDGMTVTHTPKPEPRFGTTAPLMSTQVRFPSGRLLNLSRTRTSTLANRDDILSLQTQIDTFTTDGRTTTVAYDSSSRETRVTTPSGRTILVRADSVQRPVLIQSPGLLPTTFAYTDGLLRSSSRGTRSYAFAYDDRRRLTTVTDPLQRPITLGYDDADRIVGQTLSDGRVIRFVYDADGNLTTVTPPARPSHSFTFNAGAQVGSYVAPMGALTRYIYDADRKLTDVVRPDGSLIEFTHDSAGRLSRIDSADASVEIALDSAGRVDRAASTSGSLAFSYDGTLLTGVSAAGAVPATVNYAYDGALRLQSETVNGSTIMFTWDGDNLLTQAGALSLTPHADHGLLSGTTVGGVVDSFSYDEHGDLSSYSASFTGTPIYSVTYGRDSVGRIASRSETLLGTTTVREYAYDPTGRLHAITSGGIALHEYDYDGNSNRTAHRWLGGSAAGDYDAEDRLLVYGDASYTYTQNGDLSSVTLGGAITSYAYDSFGNLKSVQLPGGVAIEYVVDAQNRRVGKKVNGSLTRGWVYSDQLRIAAELDGSGAMVSRFVYASRANVPDYLVRGGVTYRVLSDHLGSPRVVVNAADGSIAQQLEYDDFGNVISDTNPGFQPFGFAGGVYDHDTRLLRFGARDYDPRTGRWTAKDPVLFAGGDTNLYGYVVNDPVNLIDPLGLLPWGPRPFGPPPAPVQAAENFAKGSMSYSRGLQRAGRFVKRASGGFGACEQKQAKDQFGIVVLAGYFGDYAVMAKMAAEAANDNKAYLAGRATTAAVATGVLTLVAGPWGGRIGLALGVTAMLGDATYALEEFDENTFGEVCGCPAR